MLTPTKAAIDPAMTYGREKLGLATLKPEQETAISILALGKDNTTGSQCFLNRCEEPTFSGVRDLFCKRKKDVGP